MTNRNRLQHLLDAPLRVELPNAGRKPYSFDPELAVTLWKSGEYRTITALANRLGAKRRAVSNLLHQRGLIESLPPANGHG